MHFTSRPPEAPREQCRMKSEIAAVVSFLKRLVKLKNKVEVEKMDLFAERLTVALQEKFEGHWVPERPSKGQAYRCIRVNAFHKYDPELLRACRESGVHYGDLGLPWEITLWVDPGEVCGRGAHIPPPSPSPTGSAR
uniref:B-cell translocation gene 3 n=1 Tax=Gouania willdenowi TaxID=441366 RepID=A0A8C5DIU5_GOUWI